MFLIIYYFKIIIVLFKAGTANTNAYRVQTENMNLRSRADGDTQTNPEW